MRTFLVLFSISLFFNCKQPSTGSDYSKLETIPTKEQVGHLVLPDTIAPVEAPFDMPLFEKPTFPDRTINIKERIDQNSNTITTIVETAINELSRLGGGKVIIPKGVWNTGRISLKSNVNLHIEEGAVVQFSTHVKDYQPAVFTRVESMEVMSLAACIYANNQENIAITGKGKLIGPYGGEIKERAYHTPIETLVDLSKPAEARIHDGSKEDWIFPPKFISPVNCKKVYIEGISLENTAFWNIVPVYCDNVIIRGVSVNSVGIPRCYFNLQKTCLLNTAR